MESDFRVDEGNHEKLRCGLKTSGRGRIAQRHQDSLLQKGCRGMIPGFHTLRLKTCSRILCIFDIFQSISKALILSNDIEKSGEWYKKTLTPFQLLVTSFNHFLEHISNEEKTMEMKETFLLSLYCPSGRELNGFRNVLSAEWSDLGELRFNMAVTFISNKDFKCGLGHLGKMYCMVEETKRFGGKNTAAAAVKCNQVTALESDYYTCLAMGQSLQAMHVGEDMVKLAVQDEELVNYDLVWDALDKFKEAELLSKGEDVELLCMALFYQGRVFANFFLTNSRFSST
jgi:hypothetical protein